MTSPARAVDDPSDAVVHGGLDPRELAMLGVAAANVIDLSANLHPDGPPPEVLDALRDVDVTHYPAADAAPLRDAIAHAHDLDPACVIITPGSAAAIYLVLGALLRAGDACALFAPTFGEYAPAVRAAGGEVCIVQARLPAFALDAAPATPVAVLCNPDNPTGRYLDRAGVEGLLGRAGQLVLDAAYEPLAEGRWDADALVREGAPVTVIHSFTKHFAMPGVRLGYVVATPEVSRALSRRQPPWPVGAHAIAAGLAALALEDARARTLTALHARRRCIEAALSAAGVRTSPARANFVLAEVGDAPAFRARLLRRGFAVRDATSFGLPRWVRIAVPAEAHVASLLAAITATLEDTRHEAAR